MQSSNPVLKRGFAQMDPSTISGDSLEATYNAPAASSMRTGRMTLDDVIARTGFLFLILAVTAAFTWKSGATALALPGMIVGFILAMVISFSSKVRPALVIAYAVAEGFVIGAISKIFEASYPGIVSQAVLATFAAFAGILIAYKTGKVRATAKFTRIMMASLIGYMILGIVLLFVGFPTGGIGLLIALGGVGLATFFFVLDFDQIERGVAAGVPAAESWRAAFGLMVTMIWLYMEVLRLLAILRDRD